MSCHSDNEDFYDAFDVTPMQSKSSLTFTNRQNSLEKRTPLSSFANDDYKEVSNELSFGSNESELTKYESPIKSEPSKEKCSVVILEPDIVQSTKSSSLPRQQLPIATTFPRKKKAKSADLPLYNPEDQELSSNCLMTEAEGSGSVTPRMPECSSPVLDITSATKGSCLVTLYDQIQLENKARRDSKGSWDSNPSKELSSTDELLSSELLLNEEEEEEEEECQEKRKIENLIKNEERITKKSPRHSSVSELFSSPNSFFPSFYTTPNFTKFASISKNLQSSTSHEKLAGITTTRHQSLLKKSELSRASFHKTIYTLPIGMAGEEKEECSKEIDDSKSEDITKVICDDDDDDDEYEDDNEDLKDNENNKFKADISDQEILDKTMVLNLETGETVPLSSAEEKLPKCINPLSLHIMRRTKEYSSSDSNLQKQEASDIDSAKTVLPEAKKSKVLGRRRMRIKQFFGKTVNRFKSVAEKSVHTDDTSTDEDDITEHRKSIKIKNSHSHKGPYDFELLVPIQEIGEHKSGAIWTMKFSHCGRLLATGGQDGLLRVWVLHDALQYFTDLRLKYSEVGRPKTRSEASPTKSPEQKNLPKTPADTDTETDQSHLPFHKQPFSTYRGHTADVLDISWSKNYFLLSSSMDMTVRLWHISRYECLCCFKHIDFVTAISFHPKDDRYFLSGSLDGKLRLWNIPDKKVALWNEVVGPAKLITAANFCLNGRFAVVGTYDGRCIFYSSEHLKYFTQIHVRSTRGRNKRGRKITGVEPFPGENKILVTSNDSRVRLYDLRDLTLTCKFKGVTNKNSQIKASFSHDGKYIVCGSEDQFMYIWKTQHDFYKFSSARKDRNNYWEGIKAHSAVVTNAIFAPDPEVIIKPQFEFVDSEDKGNRIQSEVLVSADYLGSIKIFINKFKPPS